MGKDFKRRKDIVYKLICDDMYVPMKIKELAIVLGVKKEDRPQLEEILLELMAEMPLSRRDFATDFLTSCPRCSRTLPVQCLSARVNSGWATGGYMSRARAAC